MFWLIGLDQNDNPIKCYKQFGIFQCFIVFQGENPLVLD